MKPKCAMRICFKVPLPLLLLLTLPAVVQAQLNYTTNNGTITITGYTGRGGALILPSTINGLPVTSIGVNAFYDCTSLTSVAIGTNVASILGSAFEMCSLTNVTIPSSVTSIGDYAFSQASLTSLTIGNGVTSIGQAAFSGCSGLTSVIIGNNVTSIGDGVFEHCWSLKRVTMPDSVTNIGYEAFADCRSLTNITIPNSVTSIEDLAFQQCTSLTAVYFQGNAPSADSSVFDYDSNATVYFLPGTVGWGSMTWFGGIPAVLWNPQVQTTGLSFGVQTNRFGFAITGTAGLAIVVEACSSLASLTWSPVQTITLTEGHSYFSDPQWTNYPARLYRLRSP
jgi:hypothetical protein